MTTLCDKYALSTAYSNRKWPLMEVLPRIAHHGFEYLELWGNRGQFDPRSEPDVPTLRREMDSLGLKAWSIHCPYSDLRLGHAVPELMSEWLRVVGQSLEIGMEMGAGVAVVHVDSDPKEMTDEDYEEGRKLSIEFVNRLADRAEELGIRLAVEPMIPVAHLPRRFSLSLKVLAEAYTDPRIGFCPDLGHALLSGDDLQAGVPATNGRVITVHADANDGNTDLHLLPDMGVLDWPAARKLFEDNGFAGKFVLEVNTRVADDDPERFLERCAEFVRSNCDERLGSS